MAVHLQLYEEELTSQREELSVFDGQKELLSLSTFLYSQGFKKISRCDNIKSLVYSFQVVNRIKSIHPCSLFIYSEMN